MTQNEYFFDVIKDLAKKFDQSHTFVEVGTAGGTSAFWTMKALKEAGSKSWFFTVDPYGWKPYKAGDSIQKMDYNDSLYMDTIPSLYKYAKDNELKYCHWRMRSLDFMDKFPDIEFWDDGDLVTEMKYAFVFLDGDHNWDPVFDEFLWFYERMPEGGVIAIDDFNLLNGEHEVRQRLGGFKGQWFFNYSDNHCRVYLQKHA